MAAQLEQAQGACPREVIGPPRDLGRRDVREPALAWRYRTAVERGDGRLRPRSSRADQADRGEAIAAKDSVERRRGWVARFRGRNGKRQVQGGSALSWRP